MCMYMGYIGERRIKGPLANENGRFSKPRSPC